MNRQPLRVVFALAAPCFALAAVTAGGQNPADRFAGVELEIVPVAGQVHMIQRPGGGGNVGVFAGPDGVLLVDSLFAPLAERLIAAVRRVSDGEIRFLAGSHKMGKLPHILEYPDGAKCSPHLNTDDYKLEDTVPAPAKRGDVVVFHIYCFHGSYINQTKEPRRMARMGFRDPHNDQLAGQSNGRPGLIVHGYRERRGAEELLKQT